MPANPKLQKIIKLTQSQYDTLSQGGTVGDYTGLDDRYLYLIQDDTEYQPLNSKLTSISNLSSSSTGLIKLTNGTASLDTTSYLPLTGGTMTGDIVNNIQTDTTLSDASIPGRTAGNLHISTKSYGSGSDITNGYLASITFGTDTIKNNAQAGIYTVTSGSYGTYMMFGTTNSYSTGSQTRMTITPTGNVGIGTTAPGYRLTVNGKSYATEFNENGTKLSSKYLGISAKAADSDKLDGNDSTYYLNYNNLTNKPTIPTVNNATLTIQNNGTTVNTFTANASSNVTANIQTPTIRRFI